MFLDTYIAAGAIPYKYDATEGTVQSGYAYWRNYLAEKSVRLFDWEETEEIPEDEFEKVLMFNGMGFGTRYKGEKCILNCNWAGDNTLYYDRWKRVSVRSPLDSGVLTIGKNGILFRNNSLCTSILPLIHRYALMIAHTDTTYIDTMINARGASGVAVCGNEKQLQSYTEYRNSLANGKVKPVSDPAYLGIQFATSNSTLALNPKDIMEVRQDLLCSFYNDIGVRSNRTKKSNMIQAEVQQDDQMLLLNLEDMLECRERACDEFNARYGTHMTVKKSKELEQIEEANYGESDNPGTLQNKSE